MTWIFTRTYGGTISFLPLYTRVLETFTWFLDIWNTEKKSILDTNNWISEYWYLEMDFVICDYDDN